MSMFRWKMAQCYQSLFLSRCYGCQTLFLSHCYVTSISKYWGLHVRPEEHHDHSILYRIHLPDRVSDAALESCLLGAQLEAVSTMPGIALAVLRMRHVS